MMLTKNMNDLTEQEYPEKEREKDARRFELGNILLEEKKNLPALADFIAGELNEEELLTLTYALKGHCEAEAKELISKEQNL